MLDRDRAEGRTLTNPILANGGVHNHSLRLAARETRFARAMNNSGNDMLHCFPDCRSISQWQPGELSPCTQSRRRDGVVWHRLPACASVRAVERVGSLCCSAFKETEHD
jgi:hypothetical protein